MDEQINQTKPNMMLMYQQDVLCCMNNL